MDLHIKKSLRASEQNPEDIKIARKEWDNWAKTCDVTRPLFIDESSATTKEALFEAIKLAFECITSENVSGWFKSCEYFSLGKKLYVKRALVPSTLCPVLEPGYKHG